MLGQPMMSGIFLHFSLEKKLLVSDTVSKELLLVTVPVILKIGGKFPEFYFDFGNPKE